MPFNELLIQEADKLNLSQSDVVLMCEYHAAKVAYHSTHTEWTFDDGSMFATAV